MKKRTKIMVFGTFDALHPGHENFFKQARALAENPYLVVSAARDVNVKRIKGRLPRLSESQRRRRLAHHYLVDRAVLGGKESHLAHILIERPDIIGLGYDQRAYTTGLARRLEGRGLKVKVVRLKPYKKNKYKSSLLRDKKQTKPLKLGVFDIDGTVFRSSLTIELINQLAADGVFPRAALGHVRHDYMAWRNRQGTYEDYLTKVVETYQHYIKGRKVAQVDRAIKKVIVSQKDQVYRYTRDLIKQLSRQGYFLIAISGSSINIVEPFARYFKFHAYHGRISEIKNGRYTSAVLNNEVMNKDKSLVLKAFLREQGIKADWKNSVVVGDTETEIPLLRLAGKPVCFNPNMTLVRYALRRNWTIVVERKDVVFELKKFNVIPVKGK